MASEYGKPFLVVKKSMLEELKDLVPKKVPFYVKTILAACLYEYLRENDENLSAVNVILLFNTALYALF